MAQETERIAKRQLSLSDLELNEEQFTLAFAPVSDIYEELTKTLFLNMVQRLRARGTADLEREPYVWQLEKLHDLHALNEHNLKLITELSGVAEETLRAVIANEGYQVYVDTKQQLADDMGRSDGVSRYGVQESLTAYANQTMLELDNLVNTTLPQSVQEVYRHIVEETVAEVVTGISTPDKALSKTVMKWHKVNFTGFRDKAGRRWKADAYARAVITSTSYRVYNDMRTRPAEEMGVDTYYYSIKPAAREMCSPIQHQIVTKTGKTEVIDGVQVYALADFGYGEPGGCLGINCRHTLTPFVIGVNEKPDLPDYLKGLTKERAEDNAYQQARQRAFERDIRREKERLAIAKTLGDEELANQYQARIKTLQMGLKRHIEAHPFLYRDREKEKYSGIVSEREHSKVEQTIRRTAQEYKDIVQLLGNKAPQSLENYRQMRYNGDEDYAKLKDKIYIQEQFNSGKWLDKINPEKQARHIQSTALANKSYFYDDVDVNALYEKYKLTGELQKTKKGNRTSNEKVDLNSSDIVGVDVFTGNIANALTIKYSKTGVHIIPTYFERD